MKITLEGTSMRIALVSSWNACCGVSIHAELIGEALQRKGHTLRVLAPASYEDDGTRLIHAADQPHVTRCYSFLRYGDRCSDIQLLDSLYFDTAPLLEESFDLVLVEKPTSIPLKPLKEALPRLKEAGRLVAVLHEGTAPENPFLGRVDWDAATIFDERYRRLFKGVIPDDRVHLAPFPCHPVERRPRSQARDRLGLPRDAEVVFSYGGLGGYMPVIEAVARLGEERDRLLYLLLAGAPQTYMELKNSLGEDGSVRILFGRPPTTALYDYLCASDALILHKRRPPHVAVSSTAHLCMGSLTPLLCNDTTHFEMLRGEVIKYRDSSDIEEKLRLILEGAASEVTTEARRYVETNSADTVAEKLLELAG